ncbi:MAG: RNA polymerase sigma factor FliA [Castellaniella sp.]|uniref:RNA polymerase sigma factor FliA n=1 Tax=Castellaniella sp. TaxID=1955812 RepID=UPI0012022FD6|nr:RNA polymerase sigma factor FliA [Castellaniella sp.]TAN27739.1 MAG: RNA polymerase sigma factor FliA [Castellaniella sp.]
MPLSEDQLIGQYAPLVRRQALALIGKLPANVELDDLMQAGMMGLLDAVRRYQQQADAQFETYAVTRIRGAMLDELRSQDWLPRSVRTKARSIEASIRTLNHRLMRQATESEIAEEMGLDLAAYQTLLEEARGVQVLMYEDLAQHREDRDGESVIDSVAADTLANPLDWLMHDGLRTALIRAIESLPEREKLLLSLQFEQDLNQKEIAAVLQITEGRVSQIRSQAVARIRAWLAEHSWEPEADAGGYVRLL